MLMTDWKLVKLVTCGSSADKLRVFRLWASKKDGVKWMTICVRRNIAVDNFSQMKYCCWRLAARSIAEGDLLLSG